MAALLTYSGVMITTAALVFIMMVAPFVRAQVGKRKYIRMRTWGELLSQILIAIMIAFLVTVAILSVVSCVRTQYN